MSKNTTQSTGLKVLKAGTDKGKVKAKARELALAAGANPTNLKEFIKFCEQANTALGFKPVAWQAESKLKPNYVGEKSDGKAAKKRHRDAVAAIISLIREQPDELPSIEKAVEAYDSAYALTTRGAKKQFVKVKLSDLAGKSDAEKLAFLNSQLS